MRRHVIARAVLGLAVAVAASGCGGRLGYDENLLLYDSGARGFRRAELGAALDAALAEGRPVILFVHGRGREPRKGLEGTPLGPPLGVPGQAVPKLERLYGARVLMVSWESARGGLPLDFDDRDEPLSHMEDAAERFGTVLAAVAEAAPPRPARPPLALLVHSMGSVVVETYVRRELAAGRPGWPVERLFDAVVFSSADSDQCGHAAWLQPIAAREVVYVTVNPDDAILQRSTECRPPDGAALGLDPGGERATAATYVELAAGAAGRFDRHEVFSVDPDGSARGVAHFFAAVLCGRRPSLAPSARAGLFALPPP